MQNPSPHNLALAQSYLAEVALELKDKASAAKAAVTPNATIATPYIEAEAPATVTTSKVASNIIVNRLPAFPSERASSA